MDEVLATKTKIKKSKSTFIVSVLKVEYQAVLFSSILAIKFLMQKKKKLTAGLLNNDFAAETASKKKTFLGQLGHRHRYYQGIDFFQCFIRTLNPKSSSILQIFFPQVLQEFLGIEQRYRQGFHITFPSIYHRSKGISQCKCTQ